LITGHSKDILEKIHYGLIDVGIVYNPPNSTLYNVETIREESILLAGAPQKAKELGSVKSESLKGSHFIHYNWGTDFTEWFETEIGNHESMRFRVDHTRVELRLLLKGEGIGFMLESIIEKYAGQGLISRISFNPGTIYRREKYIWYAVEIKKKG
jgi:LysR family transcriptional repressor of citA